MLFNDKIRGFFMQTIQIEDSFITTLFETKFYNDKVKFVEAIKELFKNKSKLETHEYNLLKAYDRGELSLGQVAEILSISKSEVMDFLKKYDIPYVRVDSEYLDQEFGAFK